MYVRIYVCMCNVCEVCDHNAFSGLSLVYNTIMFIGSQHSTNHSNINKTKQTVNRKPIHETNTRSTRKHRKLMLKLLWNKNKIN